MDIDLPLNHALPHPLHLLQSNMGFKQSGNAMYDGFNIKSFLFDEDDLTQCFSLNGVHMYSNSKRRFPKAYNIVAIFIDFANVWSHLKSSF